MVTSNHIDLIRPGNDEQARRASEAVRALKAGRHVFVGTKQGGAGAAVALPDGVVDLLVEVLGHLARGNAVTVTPLHADLTTQQAAGLLNVSRPYLVQLLEGGAIPFRRVGTRRRVRLADLLAYKEREDAGARAALSELSKQAQEVNLGY